MILNLHVKSPDPCDPSTRSHSGTKVRTVPATGSMCLVRISKTSSSWIWSSSLQGWPERNYCESEAAASRGDQNTIIVKQQQPVRVTRMQLLWIWSSSLQGWPERNYCESEAAASRGDQHTITIIVNLKQRPIRVTRTQILRVLTEILERWMYAQNKDSTTRSPIACM